MAVNVNHFLPESARRRHHQVL